MLESVSEHPMLCISRFAKRKRKEDAKVEIQTDIPQSTSQTEEIKHENETETTQAPVADVDWPTVDQVMRNVVVFDGNNTPVKPKEIHVLIDRVPASKHSSSDTAANIHNSATSTTSAATSSANAVTTKIPKARSFNFVDDIRYAKASTCAYCDKKMTSFDDLLMHYDSAHNDSYDDVVSKANTRVGRKVLERKNRYESFGIDAVEYRGKYWKQSEVQQNLKHKGNVLRLC